MTCGLAEEVTGPIQGSLEMLMRKRQRSVERSGVPTGRRGEDLNRGLLPEEDARYMLRGPFRYEWWYFHAVFENGYSTVGTILPLNLNHWRPWRRECAVLFAIYGPGGESRNHFIFPPRHLYRASYTHCDVLSGDNYVRGVHPHYEVHFEEGEDVAHLFFEALTPGWRPGTGINYFPFPRYRSFGWLVPVPRARVRGTLRVGVREMEVEGHGYHDHNWGEVPFARFIDNWHWGHVDCGEVGIIWSDITLCRSLGHDRIFMFLLSKGDRLILESPEISVTYGEWREDPENLHPFPGRISVSFGTPGDDARGEFTMRVGSVVETQDLLEKPPEVPGRDVPPAVKRFIHGKVAKPCYFRWRSMVDGSVEIEGNDFTLEGETIHEQMILHGRFLERQRGGAGD